MSKTSLGLALGSFILTTALAHAAVPLATKKALTLDAAKQIAVAAEAEAKKNGWTVVIAIVDDGGQLVYLERLDGTQLGSIDVAQGKAKTALRFKRPSKAFEDVLAGGRTAILGLDVIPIEGGIPLVVDGQIIGAIGVSGVTSQQDGIVAKAGADALSTP
jgi:glc operon protein GlcG